MSATAAFRVTSRANDRYFGAKGAERIRKGLCIFVYGNEIKVQTPKADTSMWWCDRIVAIGQPTNEKEAIEEFKASSLLSTASKLVPCEKGDRGSLFLPAKELRRLLGIDPVSKGFVLARKRQQGERIRGYWAKEEKKLLRTDKNDNYYEEDF